MDYDRIILELLNRVSVLEEKVEILSGEKTAKAEIRSTGGKKYRFLSDYLYKSGSDRVQLSFGEIENILNEKLPASAYKHRAFWANTESHSIALSWMNVGYQTVEADLEKEIVVFEKLRKY